MKSSSKVYLSESEKFERRELLSNKEFVKSLGERLSSPAENFESKKTQNLALKLLLEADPSVSKEVAKGVVAGFGPASYYMAVDAIPNLTSEA